MPLAIGIAFYLLGVTLLYPHIGIAVNESNGSFAVTNVNKTSWAHEQGIKVGDRIIQINGKAPAKNIMVRKFGIVEKSASLAVQRGQEIFQYQVKPVPSKDVLIAHTIGPSIVFLVFLLLSGGLFTRRSPEAFGLFYFLLTTTFSYIGAGASARGDILARLITPGALIFIPVTFLFFLRSYFSKIGVRTVHIGIVRMLAVLSGIVALTNGLFMIMDLGGLYAYFRFTMLGSFSLGIVISTYYLLANFVLYRNTHHATILKIMLMGVTVSFFPFVVLSVVPLMAFGFEIVSGSLAAAFVLVLPLVFFYLVTAKRLIDINFMLDRLRYFSLIAVIPSAALYGFVHLAGMFESDYITEVRLVAFFYLVTVAFLYAKEAFDKKLRKYLFRKNEDFQESLQRITSLGTSIVKMKELETALLDEIIRVIPVESLTISTQEKYGNSALRRLLGEEGWIIGRIIEANDKVFIPIGESSKQKYMLELGRKKNGTRLNEQECIWLNTLSQYVCIMITNLDLIEGLTDELQDALMQSQNSNPMLLRTLFSWSEKERRRLAFDLHDTALQDQLLIYRKLETLIEQREISAGVVDHIADIKERVLDVIYEIRNVCNELRPPFLQESGIIEAVEQLFKRFQMEANFKIHFSHDGPFLGIHLDYVLTIYRVVQELLWNAMKHSQSTDVHLHLLRIGNEVHLSYKDNGVGMNIHELRASDSHIGLSGITGRISSLGGSVLLDSKAGEGFSVNVSFPIHKALFQEGM